MELVFLNEVDSTSTHAASLLAGGKKAPFAVCASQQSSGRGRRGNAWESPEGNLFLTLVLPPPNEAPSQHGILPIKAGVLIARCILAKVGLRVTLKWPNDLLFAGRKVGGLLLETSTMGGKVGEVIVGLGLNLNVAPKIEGAAYDAVSLADVVGEPQDARSWATDLARDFEKAWRELTPADVAEAFAEFAIPAGDLWRDARSGDLRRGGVLGADGSYELRALDVGGEASRADPVVLTSADHGYAWVYLQKTKEPLFVVDVGNTAVKLAAFADARDAKPTEVLRVANDAEVGALKTAFATLRGRLGVPDGYPVHVLSVSPVTAARVANAAKAVGLAPLAVPKRPVLRRDGASLGSGYALATLGADRLAAIEGALALTHGQGSRQSLVVVQAGTATTIDVVAADRRHLGGLIFPGLKTSLDVLHEVAALLPALAPLDSDKGKVLELGHETESAMREGVRYAAVGAIERARLELGVDAGKARVFVTGGYADWLVSSVPDAEVLPDLVLNGVRSMVLGGRLVIQGAP